MKKSSDVSWSRFVNYIVVIIFICLLITENISWIRFVAVRDTYWLHKKQAWWFYDWRISMRKDSSNMIPKLKYCFLCYKRFSGEYELSIVFRFALTNKATEYLTRKKLGSRNF